MYNPAFNTDYFNKISNGYFPAHLGIKIIHTEEGCVQAEMPIEKEFFAPNGYLHAGSIVTFADTIAGYSTVAHLPDKAKSFTTIELKSNFVGAIREGKLIGESIAEHLGRTTHIWRVMVKDGTTQKKIALFTCTQLIIY